jgi:hypothetical protein
MEHEVNDSTLTDRVQVMGLNAEIFALPYRPYG